SYSVELFRRKLESRDYISKHQNFARLNNFDIVKRKHEENWYFGASAGKYKYMGSLMRYQETRLDVLHELELLKYLKPGKEFTKDSPELIELFQAVNNNKNTLTKLNIKKRKVTESGKEVLEMFRLLLGFVGVELGKPIRKLDNKGDRLNHYQIDWEKFNDPIRQAIIKCTIAKDMEWLETHQVIEWVTPDDQAVQVLTEKYRTAIHCQDYEIYSQARNEVESQKFVVGFHGLSEKQSESNQRIDQIIDKAWQLLSSDEQKAILDIRPAGNDFLQEIDSKVQSKYYYSDEYMGYQQSQNSINLWKLRLNAALDIGKQFVVRLCEAFFNCVPMSEDDRYYELFDLYESHC
ncbi:MAG: hypothetical protein ACKPCP_14290, partial [Sphaerospermopsis kisseleviana]